MPWRPLFLLAAIGLCEPVWAQHEFLPLSNDFQRLYEAPLYKTDVEFHTSVKPYRRSEINRVVGLDSVLNQLNYYHDKGFLHRKAFQEHWLHLRKKDFDLSVSPYMDFRLGRDVTNDVSRNTFFNARGIYVEGRVGRQVTFYTGVVESQARFAGYANDLVDSLSVVPGMGLRRNFKDGDHDFQNGFGAVSYTPSKYFNFSLGQGKSFFGEGYRSTFLSDNAYNMPFFKIESTFWKIKYVNLWTQMYDIRREVQLEKSFRKKWMSAHYLSYNITKKLGIQLFESVIIGADTNNQGWDISFMNPVILYRPVEYASRSNGKKVMLGGGLTYKPIDGGVLYSQFILDEFVFSEFTGEPGSWRNKYAWQLGAKYTKAFGNHRLFALLEWNGVRPYTYSHNFVESNTAHFNQPLAHPWGANFTEMVFQVHYAYKRFTADLQVSGGTIGLDTAGSNWGQNIFRDYYTGNGAERFDNFIGQGVAMQMQFIDFRVGYLVNPAYNLRLELGLTRRSMVAKTPVAGIPDRQTNFVYAGLRTALFNSYFDF